jgi:hypothetical protein
MVVNEFLVFFTHTMQVDVSGGDRFLHWRRSEYGRKIGESAARAR